MFFILDCLALLDKFDLCFRGNTNAKYMYYLIKFILIGNTGFEPVLYNNYKGEGILYCNYYNRMGEPIAFDLSQPISFYKHFIKHT